MFRRQLHNDGSSVSEKLRRCSLLVACKCRLVLALVLKLFRILKADGWNALLSQSESIIMIVLVF